MDLDFVAMEIAAVLGKIDGLRAFDFPPDSIAPPAVIVGYPDLINFDATYGRGTDRITWPLIVVVGRASDRVTRQRMTEYTSGAGAKTIKETLEGGTFTAFDTVVLTQFTFDVITIGGVDYMAAVGDMDITGPGT